ncbi:MAG: phage integrase SAM-like domain-containing protein [Dysgonomonas mossii]|uniref:tyrosine-type recombinase/integrase n=1 Tax=Dysgonomonas mossii TaxID=163665 RepID=UPI0026ED7E3E|nr:phage integrase SAM-like domain-containing protein [Dysgonomonas mossii]MBS5797800.1 phage integrase SAM-like domain-containing protein [Dysgonomonas mossii]
MNLTEGGTISESKQKEIDEYEKSQRFIDYAELFKSKSTKSKSTINTYSTAIKHLMEYQSKLNENSKTPISIKFADIDMNFYNSFRQYLLDKDLSKNHIGDIIKNVIVFMNGAKEDNLYKWEKPKGFIVEKEDADTIALAIEEINKVYNLIFTEELIKEFYPDIYQNNLRSMIKSLTTERDRFLIGYYTALRISDYSRINDYNIEDGLISIWTKKKDKKVYLLMHRYLRDIIERNKGLKLPKISDQKHNDALKEIFKIAKVNNPIKTTITKGGKCIEDIKPKYELVTSHTARRSGATNMYRNGIDLLYISRLLGRSKIEQTVKYLKITTKELANSMKNNPYFTGE